MKQKFAAFLQIVFGAFMLAALASGCESSNDGASTETSKSDPAGSEDTVIRRGEALGNAPEKSLAELLQSPEQFEGETIRTSGVVRQACTRKGCWMELAENQAKGTPGVRVTFKDYGFFVPVDSAGAQAKLQGQVQLEKVKQAHVEHYEEEGASFTNKNPDGSADEVRIVATGVELVR